MESFFIEKECDSFLNISYNSDEYSFGSQIVDSPKFYYPAHIHTAIELLYFEKGEYRISTRKGDMIFSAGEAVMFRINELHCIHSLSESGFYIVVKFSPSFIMELAGNTYGSSHLNAFSLRNGEALTIDKKTCEETGLTALLLNMLNETRKTDIFSPLGIKIGISQVALILLRLIDANSSFSSKIHNDVQFDQRIYETIAYIEENYTYDITAKECADRANVSYSYFSRIFKEFTGKTFKQYLNDVRFDQVEKALCSSNASVTDILTSCGFNNAAYFSALYKKRSGVTPSEARKMLSSQE